MISANYHTRNVVRAFRKCSGYKRGLSFHSKYAKKEEYIYKYIKKRRKKTEELFSLYNWLDLHTFRSKCLRPINGSHDSLQHSRCHFVWRSSYDAMTLSYSPIFTRRPCYIQGDKNSLGRLFKRSVRPRRQVSGYFGIRNFFFPDTKISTPTHIRNQIEYARPHVSRCF